MLKYVEGDIFSSPAQVLVNTVNTVGVMGKGIAKEYKKRYPEMFQNYKEQCEKQKLVIGRLMLWYAPDHWLLQFPTKEHWRKPSKLEYIEKGLTTFVRRYADYNISSIAFPRLGCGNGELDWKDVKLLMEKYLKELPIDVFIYLGKGEDSKQIHGTRKEMEKILNQNAIDLSFSGIKTKLNHDTYMIPIEFENNGELYKAYWRDDEELTFEKKTEVIKVETEVVHQIWDDICNKRLIVAHQNVENALIYGLLNRMGYLQQVRILNDKDSLIEGYQLELGKGRNYLVKGI